MLQFIIYGFLLLCFSIHLIKLSRPTPTTTNNKKRITKLPPSPPKLPVLGNLHQLGLYAHRSLQTLARRHGPLMHLRFGTVPVVVASSAAAAREIMKTHDHNFSGRVESAVAAKLLYDYEDISTAPYGEGWRQRRGVCVVHLLSNRRVQSFRRVREEETAILMKRMRDQRVVDLSESFATLTNDVVCRAALGRKYSELGSNGGRKFNELLLEFMELLGSFNVGDFIPWLRWINIFTGFSVRVDTIAKEFDDFLEEVVDEHQAERQRKIEKKKKKKDLVDILLNLQRDKSLGFPLTRKNVKGIILDMFAAGTDTSYTVLEWAMTELLRHPKTMERLRDEARRVGKGEAEINEDDLDEMLYLKAVMKETLRMYPPIPLLVPRKPSRSVEIEGYHVPAGTMTMVNAWAIGRDPGIWEQPEEFMPERFLNDGCKVDFRGQDFELIPFGAGRRGCPGISFAMATNELVLANMVNGFDWSLPEGMRVDELDMGECPGLTIHKKVKLVAVCTPRQLHA
ncbi:unnamed protein product [Linum tenue]|uniref:Uncharacterized protein n=1 Tax=Linum tenue TaxID=586396 RepID=A0AAV0MWR0_9ROSI|nr:unnamed protein product [Linum tenue]